jgi:hypothetical protein
VGFVLPLFVVLESFTARSAVGQILWEENGHYYLIVEEDLSWEAARSRAVSMIFMGVQGHLATITSEAENTFVTTQLGDTAGAWLGGKQLPSSSEPAGGWSWITGEPWVYTNWDVGEPNNTYMGGWGKDATGQSEERLQYHHDGTHWNDLPNDPEVITPRFIVEWDVPIDKDCVQPPAGLTGWWPGDGNTADIIGGRNAVLRSEATFGLGLVNQAFSLDGDGDFVNVPHDPALNVGTGDFTVDLWVNFNTTDGEQVLVEKYVENFSETPPGWFLTKLEGNSLRFGTGPALPDHGVDSPPLVLLPNRWIHFAARRSGGVASIFVNGEEVATGPFVDNANSDASLKFGHRGNPDDTPGSTDDRGFFLNGRIDEVEVFVGRALANAEIQAIFNAGSAGKCKEPDNDEDGVPNDKDECPHSDLSATVIIDGCNTEVPNTLFPSGCTIADLITACAEDSRNHGQFVRCVAHVTNDLKKDGIITGQQKGAIQSCAAQADMP